MENNFDVSKNDKGKYEVHLNITGDYMFETDSKKVADSIIEALEKTISKKVIVSPWNGICGVPYKTCPTCDALVWGSKLDKELKFCNNCGQKLDWSKF